MPKSPDKMTIKPKDRQEKIEHIILKLTEESKMGTPIIVEGKKDATTLKNLGIEGKIITAKTGGKTLLDVVSEIETSGTRKVVLFLDFDRRGKETTKHLTTELEHLHIKANVWFWQKLEKLINRDVHCIESLHHYIETLKTKNNHKPKTFHFDLCE